eukprot:366328-Chlamydomonas_euryale.AAC.17
MDALCLARGGVNVRQERRKMETEGGGGTHRQAGLTRGRPQRAGMRSLTLESSCERASERVTGAFVARPCLHTYPSRVGAPASPPPKRAASDAAPAPSHSGPPRELHRHRAKTPPPGAAPPARLRSGTGSARRATTRHPAGAQLPLSS